MQANHLGQGVLTTSQVVTHATMVGHATNQMRPVFSPSDGSGRYRSNGYWSDSPCDCCTELGSFCLAVWCPCVQLGMNTQKSGLGPFQKYCLLASIPEAVNYVLQVWMLFSDTIVSAEEGVTGYWVLRALQLVSSFFVLALLMNVRHRLRDMYSISGETDASACCMVWCCHPCTISQEARHIARVKGELPWPLGQGPQPGIIIGYPVMPSTVVYAGQVPNRGQFTTTPGGKDVESPVQASGSIVTGTPPAQAYGGVVIAQPLPTHTGNIAQVLPEMPVAQATGAPGPQTQPLPPGAVMGVPAQDRPIPASMTAGTVVNNSNPPGSQNGRSQGRATYID